MSHSVMITRVAFPFGRGNVFSSYDQVGALLRLIDARYAACSSGTCPPPGRKYSRLMGLESLLPDLHVRKRGITFCHCSAVYLDRTIGWSVWQVMHSENASFCRSVPGQLASHSALESWAARFCVLRSARSTC